MYVGQNWGFAETFGLKSMKSIMLALLMVSMSLSVGLVELNKAPWLVEDAESVLEESNKPMHTTAPSISYSSSTLALSNNTAMTPLTVTNSGGTVGIPVATKISNMNQYNSLALDSDGYRHASLSDAGNNDLKYATDANGAWVNITVDAPGKVGDYNSIAVDSGDGVHIAYYDEDDDDLKYAACSASCASASAWANTTIDATGSVGTHTSIAVDSNDKVHILYTDQGNDALKYAACASSCDLASSWADVSVDNMGSVAGEHPVDIAIDSNDAVHIAYIWHQSGSDYMRYATCSTSCHLSSSWANTTGMSLLNGFDNAEIAIGPNDGLHIAGGVAGDIIYLTCTSSCTSNASWSNISAVTAGNVGERLSLAVDSNNNPHMSYQDYDFPWTLGYATCASSCTSASSFWSKGVVDSTNNGGFGTSIAVNHNNDSIHIIHLHYGTQDLVYLGSGTAPYSVSPELPTGLNLDWSNGEISGTPTELSSSTTYTITARNAHGSDTTTLTISVNAPPLMSYDWGSGSSNFLSSEYVNNKLDAGFSHTCAILENGSVMCWGRDHVGQLGNGATTTASQDEPVLVDLPSGRTAVAVSAGLEHTCVLLDNGSVMCWGKDNTGQLGNGATTTATQDEPVLVDLPTGRSAVGLAAGGAHSCALLDTGSLMCWGLNADGQLGNGDFDKGNEDSPVYVNLPYSRTAVAVSVGNYHTCALLDTGSLVCSGRDNVGQLGEGAGSEDQVSPVHVDLPTGRTAVSIVAAHAHSCAILDNGSLMCWGEDGNSQLGNGAGTSDQQSPDYVDLPTGLGAVAVDAGDHHTCAILDNESTYCWGSNVVGGLGIDDPTDTDQASPVHVNLSAGRTAVAISLGQYHTCAILDNEASSCWGGGTHGQLGYGGTSNQDSPVSVSGSHAWDTTTNLVSSTLQL